MPLRRKVQARSLSAGRPKVPSISTRSTSHPSSKRGRSLIRRYHTLSKDHARAIASGNDAKAGAIQRELDAQGGVTAYQAASRAGQSAQRGGDTSRVLIEWLKEADVSQVHLRMLEVGALAINNACARSKMFQVTRIDLHSDIPGIEQQDFMERPAPEAPEDCFDCVSLSLVVNYVPDPRARGKMLERVVEFLRHNDPIKERKGGGMLPCLFLVLPAPCLTNSRYISEERMASIMNSQGFTLKKRKLSSKLIYQLWVMDHTPEPRSFPKIEVNPGKQRNNFAIILDHRSL